MQNLRSGSNEMREAIAAKVHEAWMATKCAQGVTSRPAEDGTEQMVPYDQLPEHIKDLDRSTVNAVIEAAEGLGLFLEQRGWHCNGCGAEWHDRFEFQRDCVSQREDGVYILTCYVCGRQGDFIDPPQRHPA